MGSLKHIPARIRSVMDAEDMLLQEGIDYAEAADMPQIVAVWEASVRATHHFVSEADIQVFKPLVEDGVRHIAHLACVRAAGGEVVGFIGVAGRKIEMLFIHPAWHGMGIGRRLLLYAVKSLGANMVDVNEQNEQAVGFYDHMGFTVKGRSEFDSTGKPYPILHMQLSDSWKMRLLLVVELAGIILMEPLS